MTLSKEHLLPKDQIKLSEREYINGLGGVVACIRGLTLHYLGVNEETIFDSIKNQTQAYNDGCRKKKILILKDTEEMISGYKVVNKIQADCMRSDIAFQTRRLELISQVVRLGYGLGQDAVDAVDIMLGKKTISCDRLKICNTNRK